MLLAMNKMKTSSEPAPANLSNEQMQAAITKIERRLADLNAFDPNKISEQFSPQTRALEQKLKTLLQDIFPLGTIEHDQYKNFVGRIDTASLSMGRPTPLSEVREGLEHGVAQSRAMLETIVETFQEKLADAASETDPVKKALGAYEGLELHSEIERACSQLYRDGHYSNAIEECKSAQWFGSNAEWVRA